MAARRTLSVKKNGFTMIELLVVIGITGLLVAIAIPTFGNYERNARVRHTAQELRALFWDAQAFSLAPSDVSIDAYDVIVRDGMGNKEEVSILDDAGNSVASMVVREAVYVQGIEVDGTPRDTIAVRFLTGNREGGKALFVDPGSNLASPDDDTLLTGSLLHIMIGANADISKLQYDVAINTATSSITFDRVAETSKTQGGQVNPPSDPGGGVKQQQPIAPGEDKFSGKPPVK